MDLEYENSQEYNKAYFANLQAVNEIKKQKARERRKERNELMKSLGLVKVRGSLGGTYWE